MNITMFLIKELKNRMRKKFNVVKQNGFEIYSVSLSINELIDNTTVEYFNPNTGNGYQRALSPAHFRKIAKYLQDNSNAILPTSILTAVDPNQAKPVVEQNQVEEEEYLNISGKLRVVDGQHRIEGIKYLKDHNALAYEKIKDYSFSTLIMVISPENKVYEIESFININKTSKPVSTDLAIQLRDKIKGNDITKILKDINTSIAMKICQNLNSSSNSIWFQSIKLGNDTLKGKTISINAFHLSVIGVVDNYIKNTSEIKTIDECNKIAII